MDASTRLDRAPADEARALLARCCGARRWVTGMLSRRPFLSDERLQASARDVWFGLDRDDWLEGFSHHPPIGDRAALSARFAATGDLSQKEQAAVDTASAEVIDALARRNREYRDRFGYIFIVCATGKSATEMLALLEARLTNDPDDELRIAAGEQAKITAIRLAQLAAVD